MRDPKIDIVKGIGIVLVVLGHCTINPITSFVYLFHMPMFFLISGYLYREDSEKNVRIFLKRKFLGLYVPYLIFELFFTIMRNFLLDIGFLSEHYLYSNKYVGYLDTKGLITTVLKDIFLVGREPLVGTLWFLVVLIFVNIMFLIISVFSRKIEKYINIEAEKIRLLFVFIAFFAGNLMTKLGFTIPRCNNSLVMLGVFYIGVLIRKHKDKIVFNNLYCIICFLILVLNNFYGNIAVNANSYLSPAFLIVNCLVGSYMVLMIANILYKSRIGDFFELCGKKSFSIMVLHFSAFMLLSKFFMVVCKKHWYVFPIIKVDCIWVQALLTIPYLLVGVFLPLGMALLWEKLKVLVRKRN